MDDIAVWQTVWTALASGASALIAGLFGVTLGLRKTRGEHAFKRRLEWTEEMYEKLGQGLLVVRKAESAFLERVASGGMPSEAEINQAAPVVRDAFEAISVTADRRALYATRRASRELDDLLEFAVEALSPSLFALPPGRIHTEVHLEWQRRVEKCRAALARDIRRQYGRWW